MKQELPLISIITVVYNDCNFIEKTILSIINQTYPNIQYIIIDGGSNDGTIDIIKKYENKISYWISEPDKGIYYAMNKGIIKARGEWVNFMNSGDWFYKNDTIEQIFNNRDLKDIEFLYGNTEKRYAREAKIYVPGNESDFWNKLMVHQSIFSRINLNMNYIFDTGFKVSADFDFIFKVFFYKHKTLYLNIIISSFDMIGYSHHNRYVGFAEDRKISLKYKGNMWLSYNVYFHYLFLTFIGKVIDVLKIKFPGFYKKLKAVKG